MTTVNERNCRDFGAAIGGRLLSEDELGEELGVLTEEELAAFLDGQTATRTRRSPGEGVRGVKSPRLFVTRERCRPSFLSLRFPTSKGGAPKCLGL